MTLAETVRWLTLEASIFAVGERQSQLRDSESD
jgi:hypothetical protein